MVQLLINFQIFITITIIGILSNLTSLLAQNHRALSLPLVNISTDAKIYPPLYQPYLNGINVSLYFRNKRLVRFQVHCLFYGGHCDTIGKWAKPRIIKGLLGRCLNCTKEQEYWIDDIMKVIYHKFPILYRATLGRFLEYIGISVPPYERKLIKRHLED